MKKIGILGSTGSVGSQCLNLIQDYPEKINLVLILAHSSVDKIIEQAKLYNPKYVCLINNNHYIKLKDKLPNKTIIIGKEDVCDLISNLDIDLILNAISGYEGLELSIEVLKNGIDLALSNKESIVQAGNILKNLSKKFNSEIFPVDSEHSALWQCLLGEKNKNIKKLILTGSGGPFRTFSIDQMEYVDKESALKHPNWSMGQKISIDSATMMNKGFEVIEAHWLFNIDYKKIDIIIHPESIIHSMIEFIDGSIKAQLSEPDMRIPIQFALTFPERFKIPSKDFDFIKNNKLNFEKIDNEKFPCIKLAYDAGNKAGTYTTVLNVANDIAVKMFLKNEIKFINIHQIIEDCLNKHDNINNPSVGDIFEVINWTESYIKKEIKILL